jgi:hypothetical protein
MINFSKEPTKTCTNTTVFISTPLPHFVFFNIFYVNCLCIVRARLCTQFERFCSLHSLPLKNEASRFGGYGIDSCLWIFFVSIVCAAFVHTPYSSKLRGCIYGFLSCRSVFAPPLPSFAFSGLYFAFYSYFNFILPYTADDNTMVNDNNSCLMTSTLTDMTVISDWLSIFNYQQQGSSFVIIWIFSSITLQFF